MTGKEFVKAYSDDDDGRDVVAGVCGWARVMFGPQ